jgi:hypothetical protein
MALCYLRISATWFISHVCAADTVEPHLKKSWPGSITLSFRNRRICRSVTTSPRSKDCEQARLPAQVAYSICVVRLFLFLGILLMVAPLVSSEYLLFVDVYARILPEGQIEPIPDPFIEAIVSGKEGPLPAGVQEIQGKTFRIESASRDLEAVIPGVDTQRVELSFTAAVLPNGGCAVTSFQLGAASESSRGNVMPSNSSQTMSRGGFTVAPGQRIPQSVSVKFGDGLIF